MTHTIRYFRRVALATALLGASLFAQAPAAQYMIRIEPLRAGFTLQQMTQEEQALAVQHMAYLRGLYDQGKITFAGQALDPKGLWGVIVVSAASSDEALALMNGDPSMNKLFRGTVAPFRTVLERGAKR